VNGAVAGGVFLASLLGSLHCVGMCGPLVALCTAMPGGEPRRGRGTALHAAHALGRLTGYAAIGALAGAAGSAIDLAGTQAGIARAAAIGAGFVVVLAGVHGLLAAAGVRTLPLGGAAGRVTRWIAPAIAALRAQPPVPRAALVGLLSAGLPCGWLWAFVVVAAGTANAAAGAWTMIAFWAGTVPALWGAGVAARWLSAPLRRRVPAACAVLLVVLGLVTVLGRAGAPTGAGTPGGVPACHAAR